jgi:hypothetical protein
MSPRTRRLAWLAAGAVVLLVVYGAANALYLAPRASLQAELQATTERIAAMQDRLSDEQRVRRQLREFASTTLGKEQDLVEHRFRSGLSGLAERAGLKSIEVNHGRPSPMRNPMVTVARKSATTAVRNILNAKPDAQLIRGQVQGVGTLEQSLQLIAGVESQPWIHRVEGFSLRPRKGGDQFDVRVDVLTAYVPDLLPKSGPDPELAPPAARADSQSRALAMKNPFKIPAAVLPPQSPAVQVLTAATPVPSISEMAAYADYKLTGVVRSSQGVVAFLLNTKSGEKLTLLSGGRVLDAILVGGQGEKAIFEITGKQFEVFNGNSLAARRVIPNPVHSAPGVTPGK